MTKLEAEGRTRRWTRRTERGVRYGPFARFSDWWCASRDGRKGIPEVNPGDRRPGGTPGAGPAPSAGAVPAPLPGTPRMMFLGQLALGQVEKEWIVYRAEVADTQAALRDSEARRAALDGELGAANKRLARAQDEPEQTARTVGEERTDEDVVRDRRKRERAARIQRERDAVDSLVKRIEAVNAEIAQSQERIDIRLEIAQRRAAMIEAHILRRSAAYLTRLVRKHPDGKKVNELLRPSLPELPAWTRTTRSSDRAGEVFARKEG